MGNDPAWGRLSAPAYRLWSKPETVWVVANKLDGRIRHYDSNQISLSKNHTIDLNI
jgi:hypothetical protein